MTVWRMIAVSSVAVPAFIFAQVPVFFLGWALGTATNSMAPMYLLELVALWLAFLIGRAALRRYETIPPEGMLGAKRYAAFFLHAIIAIGLGAGLLAGFAYFIDFARFSRSAIDPQTRDAMITVAAPIAIACCLGGCFTLCLLAGSVIPPNSTVEPDAREGGARGSP